LDEAMLCYAGGADYVGVGPVFATSSKMDAGPAGGLDLVRTIAAKIPLPIIAIGGVDEENAAHVLRAGARGIAVISAVCCRPDPKASTAALNKVLQFCLMGKNG
ncbi:MAG TPA: thiamine phosphate synthase, partial [Deltaproteobacteria bacterium]|nr:thiamine phosphate synthase [Deltaproteobacteria bacterium]